MICVVPGCNADVSGGKKYLKRHKLCSEHLQAKAVLIDGQQVRFCQQCGRFQPVTDFKDDRRNCQAALRAHNARRRVKKDAPFRSSRLPSTRACKRPLPCTTETPCSSQEQPVLRTSSSSQSDPSTLQQHSRDGSGAGSGTGSPNISGSSTGLRSGLQGLQVTNNPGGSCGTSPTLGTEQEQLFLQHHGSNKQARRQAQHVQHEACLGSSNMLAPDMTSMFAADPCWMAPMQAQHMQPGMTQPGSAGNVLASTSILQQHASAGYSTRQQSFYDPSTAEKPTSSCPPPSLTAWMVPSSTLLQQQARLQQYWDATEAGIGQPYQPATASHLEGLQYPILQQQQPAAGAAMQSTPPYAAHSWPLQQQQQQVQVQLKSQEIDALWQGPHASAGVFTTAAGGAGLPACSTGGIGTDLSARAAPAAHPPAAQGVTTAAAPAGAAAAPAAMMQQQPPVARGAPAATPPAAAAAGDDADFLIDTALDLLLSSACDNWSFDDLLCSPLSAGPSPASSDRSWSAAAATSEPSGSNMDAGDAVFKALSLDSVPSSATTSAGRPAATAVAAAAAAMASPAPTVAGGTGQEAPPPTAINSGSSSAVARPVQGGSLAAGTGAATSGVLAVGAAAAEAEGFLAAGGVGAGLQKPRAAQLDSIDRLAVQCSTAMPSAAAGAAAFCIGGGGGSGDARLGGGVLWPCGGTAWPGGTSSNMHLAPVSTAACVGPGPVAVQACHGGFGLYGITATGAAPSSGGAGAGAVGVPTGAVGTVSSSMVLQQQQCMDVAGLVMPAAAQSDVTNLPAPFPSHQQQQQQVLWGHQQQAQWAQQQQQLQAELLLQQQQQQLQAELLLQQQQRLLPLLKLQQQVGAGVQYTQQLVRLSIKLHGVTPEQLPSSTVAAMQRLLMRNAADVELIMLPPSIRHGCIQIEFDVLVKVQLSALSQQDASKGGFLAAAAPAAAGQPGQAGLGQPGTDTSSSRNLQTQLGRVSLAAVVDGLDSSPAQQAAEDQLRRVLPFEDLVSTLLDLPLLHSGGAGAGGVPAASAEEAAIAAGSSTGCSPTAGDKRAQASPSTSRLSSCAQAIYAQVGSCLGVWRREEAGGLVVQDWTPHLPHHSSSNDATSSGPDDSNESSSSTSKVEGDWRPRLISCMPLAAALEASSPTGSPAGHPPGAGAGAGVAGAQQGGKLTPLRLKVHMHSGTQHLITTTRSSQQDAAPLQLWATRRGQLLPLAARAIADAPSANAQQEYDVVIGLRDDTPGLLLLQAEQQVQLGCSSSSWHRAPSSTSNTPMQSASGGKAGAGIAGAAAGNSFLQDSPPGVEAGVLGCMSPLVPVLLCPSAAMVAELHAAMLVCRDHNLAGQRLLQLGLVLDFWAIYTQEQQTQHGGAPTDPHQCWNRSLLESRRYQRVILTVGTQLLLWAQVNAMSATATHLHTIMLAARNLAAATAAAAAASPPSSNAAHTAVDAAPAPAPAAAAPDEVAASDGDEGSQHGSTSGAVSERQLQAVEGASPAAADIAHALTPVEAWRFEDVDCKAAGSSSNGGIFNSQGSAGSSTGTSRSSKPVGVPLSSPSKDGIVAGDAAGAATLQRPADHQQSPVPLIKVGLQVVVVAVTLYLLSGLVQAVLRGQPPMQQLKSSLAALRYAASVVCIPLVMLGVGVVLALLQQLPGLGLGQRQQALQQ